MGHNLLTLGYGLEEPGTLQRKIFDMLFKEVVDVETNVRQRFRIKGPNAFIFFP